MYKCLSTNDDLSYRPSCSQIYIEHIIWTDHEYTIALSLIKLSFANPRLKISATTTHSDKLYIL